MMTLTREKDVCYPSYIATGPAGSARIDRPAGRTRGWCVYEGCDPGELDARTMWFGSFREAKDYARELTATAQAA